MPQMLKPQVATMIKPFLQTRLSYRAFFSIFLTIIIILIPKGPPPTQKSMFFSQNAPIITDCEAHIPLSESRFLLSKRANVIKHFSTFFEG